MESRIKEDVGRRSTAILASNKLNKWLKSLHDIFSVLSIFCEDVKCARQQKMLRRERKGEATTRDRAKSIKIHIFFSRNVTP